MDGKPKRDKKLWLQSEKLASSREPHRKWSSSLNFLQDDHSWDISVHHSSLNVSVIKADGCSFVDACPLPRL